MNHIEAIKQVLTRLEGMNHEDSIFAGEFDKEIKLLSQAIAEAEKQEPVVWGKTSQYTGQIYDCITPEEHAREEGGYTVALYREPQPKQEPPTMREVKDALRATGQLTNAQSWDVAEAVLKLFAAHGIKEKNT